MLPPRVCHPALAEAGRAVIRAPRRPHPAAATASVFAAPGHPVAQRRSHHRQRAVNRPDRKQQSPRLARLARLARSQPRLGTASARKGFRFSDVVVTARTPAAWPTSAKSKAAQRGRGAPSVYRSSLLDCPDTKILLVDGANVIAQCGRRRLAGARGRFASFFLQQLARVADRSRCHVFVMVEGQYLDCEAPTGIHLIHARDVRQKNIGDDAIVEHVFQAIRDGIDAQRFILVTEDRGLMRRMPFGVYKQSARWLIAQMNSAGSQAGETAVALPLGPNATDSGEQPGRGWLLSSLVSLGSLLPSWLFAGSNTRAKA